MLIRFKSNVDIGLKSYVAGDRAEVDDLTAQSLIDLRVAAKAPPTLTSGGDIPPWTQEDKDRLAEAIEVVRTPRVSEAQQRAINTINAVKGIPAGDTEAKSDTLPAPEKKRSGIFRRSRGS
jgi:hypothetical protein